MPNFEMIKALSVLAGANDMLLSMPCPLDSGKSTQQCIDARKKEIQPCTSCLACRLAQENELILSEAGFRRTDGAPDGLSGEYIIAEQSQEEVTPQ